MPISLAPIGQDLKIRHVSGSDKVVKHLQSLGIVKDRSIRILEQTKGGIIVLVDQMRLAIDKDIALGIQVAL